MTEETTSVAEDVETVAPAGETVENLEEETQQEAEKTVPLSALEAERRKRQDEERRRQQVEQQNLLYQQQAVLQQQQANTPKDDEDDYTKGLKSWARGDTQAQIQNSMEQLYIQENPGIVDRLKDELPDLYQRRPELKTAVFNSPNRVLAAVQFLDDYATKTPTTNVTQKRIQENQMKPKSPHSVGKTAKLSKADMISKMSSDEFHSYRKDMQRRR